MSAIVDPEIPRDFKIYASNFYIEARYPMSPEELTEHAIGAIPRQGGSLVKFVQFLDSLLEGNYSDETLARVWKRCEPSIPMRPGTHRAIYVNMRDVARRMIGAGT
jgi:hypothetical protein